MPVNKDPISNTSRSIAHLHNPFTIFEAKEKSANMVAKNSDKEPLNTTLQGMPSDWRKKMIKVDGLDSSCV
jgi:hypothetical protein